MQINLNAPFILTQACLPLLNNETPSAVLFTLDEKNSAYWGAYGVSKAGLKSFMEILADEVENTSINVTGLIPGNVKTNFRTRAFPAEDPASLTKRHGKRRGISWKNFQARRTVATYQLASLFCPASLASKTGLTSTRKYALTIPEAPNTMHMTIIW